jgi:hypothetical protein
VITDIPTTHAVSLSRLCRRPSIIGVVILQAGWYKESICKAG